MSSAGESAVELRCGRRSRPDGLACGSAGALFRNTHRASSLSPAALEVLRADALEFSPGKQTPYLLEEVFSWHERYLRTGNMHEQVAHTR